MPAPREAAKNRPAAQNMESKRPERKKTGFTQSLTDGHTLRAIARTSKVPINVQMTATVTDYAGADPRMLTYNTKALASGEVSAKLQQGGGWIDIVGVTSRIYPRTVDNRNGRAAGLNPADPSNGFSRTEASTGGCYQGAKGSARVDCGPTTHNGAPTGRPRECAAGAWP